MSKHNWRDTGLEFLCTCISGIRLGFPCGLIPNTMTSQHRLRTKLLRRGLALLCSYFRPGISTTACRLSARVSVRMQGDWQPRQVLILSTPRPPTDPSPAHFCTLSKYRVPFPAIPTPSLTHLSLTLGIFVFLSPLISDISPTPFFESSEPCTMLFLFLRTD